MRKAWFTAAFAVIVGPAIAPPGNAQQPAAMHDHEAPPAAGATYRPGLGDLMTTSVQPRHTKLGLAGAEQNWDYAAYELKELGETFDKIAKLVPKHGKLSIPEAIASTVKPPLNALGAAVKTQDQGAFTQAYADLTASCNACHQSADHAMIVIKVPTVSGTAFPDQDFSPPKK
jgi:hypothetical protein